MAIMGRILLQPYTSQVLGRITANLGTGSLRIPMLGTTGHPTGVADLTPDNSRTFRETAIRIMGEVSQIPDAEYISDGSSYHDELWDAMKADSNFGLGVPVTGVGDTSVWRLLPAEINQTMQRPSGRAEFSGPNGWKLQLQIADHGVLAVVVEREHQAVKPPYLAVSAAMSVYIDPAGGVTTGDYRFWLPIEDLKEILEEVEEKVLALTTDSPSLELVREIVRFVFMSSGQYKAGELADGLPAERVALRSSPTAGKSASWSWCSKTPLGPPLKDLGAPRDVLIEWTHDSDYLSAHFCRPDARAEPLMALVPGLQRLFWDTAMRLIP